MQPSSAHQVGLRRRTRSRCVLLLAFHPLLPSKTGSGPRCRRGSFTRFPVLFRDRFRRISFQFHVFSTYGTGIRTRLTVYGYPATETRRWSLIHGPVDRPSHRGCVGPRPLVDRVFATRRCLVERLFGHPPPSQQLPRNRVRTRTQRPDHPRVADAVVLARLIATPMERRNEFDRSPREFFSHYSPPRIHLSRHFSRHSHSSKNSNRACVSRSANRRAPPESAPPVRHTHRCSQSRPLSARTRARSRRTRRAHPDTQNLGNHPRVSRPRRCHPRACRTGHCRVARRAPQRARGANPANCDSRPRKP